MGHVDGTGKTDWPSTWVEVDVFAIILLRFGMVTYGLFSLFFSACPPVSSVPLLTNDFKSFFVTLVLPMLFSLIV